LEHCVLKDLFFSGFVPPFSLRGDYKSVEWLHVKLELQVSSLKNSFHLSFFLSSLSLSLCSITFSFILSLSLPLSLYITFFLSFFLYSSFFILSLFFLYLFLYISLFFSLYLSPFLFLCFSLSLFFSPGSNEQNFKGPMSCGSPYKKEENHQRYIHIYMHMHGMKLKKRRECCPWRQKKMAAKMAF
jgi:hypothetical protein